MNEFESNAPIRLCTTNIAAFREVWRSVSLLFIFTALLTPSTVHARLIPARILHDIAKYARCLRSNAIPTVDFHTNAISDAVVDLGGTVQIRAMFAGFQKYLYASLPIGKN